MGKHIDRSVLFKALQEKAMTPEELQSFTGLKSSAIYKTLKYCLPAEYELVITKEGKTKRYSLTTKVPA